MQNETKTCYWVQVRKLWNAKAGQDGLINIVPILVGTGLIAEERNRQIEQEGFDAAHDSQHRSVDLRNAAMCYVIADGPAAPMPQEWRWGSEWWKPKDRRRNLVKAGALYLAAADIADDGSSHGGLEATILRRESNACAALIDMLTADDGSSHGGLEAKILRRESSAWTALINMLIRGNLMS